MTDVRPDTWRHATPFADIGSIDPLTFAIASSEEQWVFATLRHAVAPKTARRSTATVNLPVRGTPRLRMDYADPDPNRHHGVAPFLT